MLFYPRHKTEQNLQEVDNMKRNLIIAALVLLCALFLYGCGAPAAPAAEPSPEPTSEPSPEPSPSAVPSAVLPDEKLEPDVEVQEPVNEAYEAAKKYIDRPLSELIEEFGEPISAEYVNSCGAPGQDGELHYDGFTVLTYKEGNSETVTYVQAND